jgi:hypothetical protein
LTKTVANFHAKVPMNKTDMDKVKTDNMFQLWKVLMAILVVSVFAGVTMQMGTVVSLNLKTSLIHTVSGISNPFKSIFEDGGSKGVAGHRARVSEHDGTLKLDKDEITRLRGRYGKELSSPRAQVQAIEEIQRLMESHYPMNVQGKMAQAIKIVFTDNVEQLLNMSAKFARYDTWLKGSWGTLLGRSKPEREGIIKDKRREIFGADADKIWPADLRPKTINQVLSGLNKVKGSSLGDKLAFLSDTIHQEYASEAAAYMKENQKDLLERFIRLDSVQADLKMMQPQVRRQNLMTIGRTLGMDENSLARWEALEKVRDERWSKGTMYMRDRQQVIDTVPDALKELLLIELRQKYFDKEAARIAGEEKAGYFRFKTKRVYGLN